MQWSRGAEAPGAEVEGCQRNPWLILAAPAPETLRAEAGRLSAYPPWPGPTVPNSWGAGCGLPGWPVSLQCIDRPLGGPGRKLGSTCLM